MQIARIGVYPEVTNQVLHTFRPRAYYVYSTRVQLSHPSDKGHKALLYASCHYSTNYDST